jgi:tRNA-dihydrouridine synthase
MIRSFVGMRKHLAWYCCDSPGVAELRAQMVRVNNIDEVVERLRDYNQRLVARRFEFPPGDTDSQTFLFS